MHLKKDSLGRTEIVGEGELEAAKKNPALQTPSMIVVRAQGMKSIPPSALSTMALAAAKATLLNYPGADAAVAQLRQLISQDPGQATVMIIGMARILIANGIAI